ncbi:MAG: GNAT family N-acetyltransferase [Caldilineaceae bacterium]|nr:GNAT family N-acetyltransferase [Caldilineaceae bacterium]
MIRELAIHELPTYLAHFPGPHLAMVTASILAGHTVAQLWSIAQDEGEPLLVLFDQGNKVFYLAGASVTAPAQAALATLLSTTIRPAAMAAGIAYFKAHPLSPALQQALPALFAWCTLHEVESLFYGLQQPTAVLIPPAIEGLRFVPIDHALLHDATLINHELVRDEVRWMWPTLERFAHYGFGIAAVMPGRIISWCTAEYVSPMSCGIGITTDEAYQGRGVATATAIHFTQRCQQQGIAPYWECARWNPASMRVAEKAGFTLLTAEKFWAGTMQG